MKGLRRPDLPNELLVRIEDAGLNASAPSQQHWLDGWLLRLWPGKAKRARCINALAPARWPLRDRLAEAQTLYRAAALPLIFRITPFTVSGPRSTTGSNARVGPGSTTPG